MKPYLIAGAWFVAVWIVIGTVPDSRAAAPERRAEAGEVAFDRIQSVCAKTGRLTAAALAGSACRVTKGRWFSTIGLQDFYQAQYCLHDPAEPATCRQRALLLFVNRAYTPEARLTLERLDAAGTEYEDPQVFATPSGYLLALSATAAPGGAPQTRYYRWQNEAWTPIDPASGEAALRSLAER